MRYQCIARRETSIFLCLNIETSKETFQLKMVCNVPMAVAEVLLSSQAGGDGRALDTIMVGFSPLLDRKVVRVSATTAPEALDIPNPAVFDNCTGPVFNYTYNTVAGETVEDFFHATDDIYLVTHSAMSWIRHIQGIGPNAMGSINRNERTGCDLPMSLYVICFFWCWPRPGVSAL